MLEYGAILASPRWLVNSDVSTSENTTLLEGLTVHAFQLFNIIHFTCQKHPWRFNMILNICNDASLLMYEDLLHKMTPRLFVKLGLWEVLY